VTTSTPHRFVIYRPDVNRIDITGSFTEWRRIPMNRVESSGYWEATLDLPQGEQRFTYILDGRQNFPDPTVLTREWDDFGGENSILLVGL
jgi:1,4-alpha-glucan branching enzyme